MLVTPANIDVLERIDDLYCESVTISKSARWCKQDFV